MISTLYLSPKLYNYHFFSFKMLFFLKTNKNIYKLQEYYKANIYAAFSKSKLIIKNHTYVKKVGYTSELLTWANKKCKNFNNVVFFLKK